MTRERDANGRRRPAARAGGGERTTGRGRNRSRQGSDEEGRGRGAQAQRGDAKRPDRSQTHTNTSGLRVPAKQRALPDAEARAVQKLRIAPEFEGQRVDNFLLRVLKGVPRTAIYRLLRRGEVRVNGGRVKPTERLRSGDLVRVPPVRLSARGAPARPSAGLVERLRDAVLFQDRDVIVLNKPAGLAVHGGSGQTFGLIEALRVMLPEERELELVHRLDQPTSGCLVVARRRSALRRWHEWLRAGQVYKEYAALVRAPWPARLRIVDVPLRKQVLRSGERIVRADPEGRPAETRFSVLCETSAVAALRVQLKTGRTHQIRVHAAHVGCPLAGDDRYGDEALNESLSAAGLRRLFLHARVLSVGDWRVCAPLPPELCEPMERLGVAADIFES